MKRPKASYRCQIGEAIGLWLSIDARHCLNDKPALLALIASGNGRELRALLWGKRISDCYDDPVILRG